MVTLAILAKQKALSVPALKAQMPDVIRIRRDPLIHEADLLASELNDAKSIFAIIDDADINDPDEVPFRGRCEVSRRSVPYVEGGPAPADDYNDIWDVIIPGGVPDIVRVSQVAILETDSVERVYTITAIGQDRLKYLARLTMVDYGLRKRA